MAMRITVECLTGSLAGKRLEFEQTQITLGRGELQPKDLDFADSDVGVSREHGTITIEGERVFYTDRSRGGTLHEGQRLQGTTIELTSGAILQLGSRNGPQLKIFFHPLPSPALSDLANATVLQPVPPPPPPFAYDGPTTLQPPPRPTLKQSIESAEATLFQGAVDREPPTTPVAPRPIEATYVQPQASEATYVQEGRMASTEATQFQTPEATQFQGGGPERTYLQGSNPNSVDPTYVQPANVRSPESTYMQGQGQRPEEATYVQQGRSGNVNPAEQTYIQTPAPRWALPSWLPWALLSLCLGVLGAALVRYFLSP